MYIYATTPETAEYYDVNQSGQHHFQDSRLCVQMWDDTISITDTTHVMQPGKKCLRVKFQRPWGNGRTELFQFFNACAGNFKTMFDTLAACEITNEYSGLETELLGVKGTVYKSEQEAIRTFSPFATLPALKEEPKKWTVAHVVKALVNGQFTELRCEGKYTDDYAYDAAYNYGKGQRSAMHLVEDLVTGPRGWWASGSRDSNNVSICCHSFNCNSFDFVLKPAPLTVQQLITKYCLDFPNQQAERAHGNALLCQSTLRALPLQRLAEKVQALGATVEWETKSTVTYLAIYAPALALAA